mmetsp:Transcript_69911/g.226085  ORF Transcript_69911/g.226085 Transcript_69911/m.226085 type:complete len:145 (-) Transcript_69911:531-965(-)
MAVPREERRGEMQPRCTTLRTLAVEAALWRTGREVTRGAAGRTCRLLPATLARLCAAHREPRAVEPREWLALAAGEGAGTTTDWQLCAVVVGTGEAAGTTEALVPVPGVVESEQPPAWCDMELQSEGVQLRCVAPAAGEAAGGG